jgi:hypothetical protein
VNKKKLIFNILFFFLQGFINLQCLPKRGYHTPTKGTITLALLNPNGTAIHLFLILYDFNDMPPDHRTFIRQRVVIMPENTGSNKQSTVENLRYLAHIRYKEFNSF